MFLLSDFPFPFCVAFISHYSSVIAPHAGHPVPSSWFSIPVSPCTWAEMAPSPLALPPLPVHREPTGTVATLISLLSSVVVTLYCGLHRSADASISSSLKLQYTDCAHFKFSDNFGICVISGGELPSSPLAHLVTVCWSSCSIAHTEPKASAWSSASVWLGAGLRVRTPLLSGL